MTRFELPSPGSFRRQVVLAFVVGFFLLILAFSTYLVTTEQENLHRDSLNETTSMAHALAASALPWVLSNDVSGMQEAAHAFHAYPEFAYAMIISPKGRVLAHSDPAKVGMFLADARSQAMLAAPPAVRIMEDSADILDVAVPITLGQQRVGWARVGSHKEMSAAYLRTMIWNNMLFLLVSTLLSFVAATLIADRLGRRIGSLVQVAEDVNSGNFATRAAIPPSHDEIALLAHSLNTMLDTLAKNERDLRAASLYTRSLIEASLDPLVTISAEGKITDVNHATEKATGLNRTALTGTDFSDYFTEPEKAREGYRRVFAEGFVTDYPLTLRHRDGHNTDVLYNASLYRDEAGNVAGVFAAARDVTERRQVERELVRLSARNRLLLDSAGEGIYGLDNEGVCTFVNPAAAQLLGYGVYELIGQHAHPVFHHTRPDGSRYPVEECPVQAAYQQGVVHRGEDMYWRRDGSSFPVEFTSTPVWEAGKIEGAVVTFRDITERKRATEALRVSEAQLKEAQRIAQLGNWNLDLVHNVLSWSDEIFRIYELDPETFGASYEAFLDAIHPDDREIVDRAYTESVRNRTPYDAVHRLLMKDGRIKYVNERCVTYYAEDGTPLHSTGTVHDITERRKVEEEVRRLNAELELRVAERTAELESFSYSVSHDLRVPLRAVDGFSRILLEEYNDRLDEEGKRLLGIVRDNTARMARLIDDILAFSRLGRKEMAQGDVDMTALANEAAAELAPGMAGREVSLEIGALPKVRGDASMLRQVWVNLLGNAIKFTRTRSPAQIAVRGDAEGAELVYCVKDNGVGFDMQYAGKLFGVFQRLHGADEFEGTGAGLAIVKRIVTRHGGRVWAEGKMNEGAMFCFALPAPEKNREPGKGEPS